MGESRLQYRLQDWARATPELWSSLRRREAPAQRPQRELELYWQRGRRPPASRTRPRARAEERPAADPIGLLQVREMPPVPVLHLRGRWIRPRQRLTRAIRKVLRALARLPSPPGHVLSTGLLRRRRSPPAPRAPHPPPPRAATVRRSKTTPLWGRECTRTRPRPLQKLHHPPQPPHSCPPCCVDGVGLGWDRVERRC